MAVDWSAGTYETAAATLAPVAEAVVTRSAIAEGERVVDVACGTGNAALLAAARGARVIGVDGAPRLLAVAAERAAEQELALDLRQGDLLALPVDDASADVVLSVFGVIFAPDPAAALRELARILHPDGRVFLSAWVPAGPIDATLRTIRTILERVESQPPVVSFPWSDTDALGVAAADAGLALVATEPAELAIRAASPEAYVDASADHPMAVAARPVMERAGIGAEVRDAMVAVLREASEEPDALLVHSPYVVHELRRAGGRAAV
jgi:SAM-dependent methyltransferase